MIIWRYGKWGSSDFTEFDQWIGDCWLKNDAPEAPAALREAIERFLETEHA